MFRPLNRSHRRPPRRGTVVLITCFFLLTIMLVLALALVMYAARERAIALAYQDATGAGGAPSRQQPDPTNTVNHFFSSLIYDTPDDGLGLQNALRGHSLARAMYGSRYDHTPGPGPETPWAGQAVPWAGVGTFHEDAATYGPYPSLAGIDRAQIVNFTGLRMDNRFLLVDPEWTGVRAYGGTGPLGAFRDTRTGNYVSKAAGYTYPDLKNFFLASQDPATGAVLTQSFFRDWLFQDPARPANESPLHRNNINWRNDRGRALTLRPRPEDHLKDASGQPLFPYPPPNADGTVTGDVQNLPGAYHFVPGFGFVARNDSLWMHIGLEPITLSDGRRVQPLVAPLILPLDGRFDLSRHGNTLRATGPAGGHHSYGGYGPWEVNLGAGINVDPAVTNAPALVEADRQALLAGRGTGPRQSAFDPFNPGSILPRYAPVAWSNPPGPNQNLQEQVTFQLPSQRTGPTLPLLLGLPSSGDPTPSDPAVPPYGNFRNINNAVNGHPAAYNPGEFPVASETNALSPVVPFSDLKRLSLRYAFTPSWHREAFAARKAGIAFVTQPTPPVGVASGAYEYRHNPARNWVPTLPNRSYRLDPTHAQRNLYAPQYHHLERPALAPNFPAVTDATALQFPLPPLLPGTATVKPNTLAAAGAAYPSANGPAPAGVTDFVTGFPTNRWLNRHAALGSVDLNRPLADYRADPNKALYPDPAQAPNGPNNNNVTAASADTANRDRQALAMDIFARLVVATGAAADVQVNPTTRLVEVRVPDPTTFALTPFAGGTVPYTKQHFDALRYLAQLAANLVDYIDNDDVSTIFQWNSTNPADPHAPGVLAADLTPAEVGNRVVFGVEKPRLVLNEVYAEITNDPADKDRDTVMGMDMPLEMDKKAHIRFWAELLNPTSPPHADPLAPPAVLGSGSVPLTAYQIQIARANRTFGPTGPLPAAQAGDTALPLVDPNNARYNGNTAGGFDPDKGAPDATFSFAALGGGLTVQSVAPNDGEYVNPNPNQPARGTVLLRTDITGTNSPKTDEFDPTATPGTPWDAAIVCPKPNEPNALGYTIQMPRDNELARAEFKRHVVLLRRLANPYLPEGPTNPFVTVDMMDYVPAFDAVLRASGNATPRTARAAGDMPTDFTKYDPVSDGTPGNNRFSVGKVQPLAGHAFATLTDTAGPTGYNVYTFGGATGATDQNSMVLNQAPATPTPGQPRHTFGRHNGTSSTQPTAPTVQQNAGTAATLSAAVDDRIMLPFDWLIHMDRPLETPGDVFFARDCKPYRLTQEFVLNGKATPAPLPAAGLNYDLSYARWRQHNEGLTRALGLLAVRPLDNGFAANNSHVLAGHGGRTAGKLNLNAVNDRRIARGVWDPQAGNQFDLPFVDNTVWGQVPGVQTGLPTSLMSSRTRLQDMAGPAGTAAFQVPIPGRRWDTATNQFVPAGSALDLRTLPDPDGGDRPFLPFGAPVAGVGGFAYSNPKAAGDGDTILRRPAPAAPPYLFLDPNAAPYNDPAPVNQQRYQAARNLYTQSEPFRKVANNVTTVSNTFAVFLTIGYFDVQLVDVNALPAGDPRKFPYPGNVNFKTPGEGLVPQFGAEVYDQVPGDMRQRYMAVVDMSNLALKPLPPTGAAGDSDAHATERPFYTALTATARPGAPATIKVAYQRFDPPAPANPRLFVSTDGQEAEITPGAVLVLGYGAEAQTVRVDAVGPRSGNPADASYLPTYPGGLLAGEIGVTGGAGLTGLVRPAWGGTVVSNVRAGYAGPRGVGPANGPATTFGFTVFDQSNPRYNAYRAVVPYIERIR